MKYLRLFLTHAEHELEKVSLEKLELYTSYCEDNDEVTIFCKKKSKYAVGDYLLSSGKVIKNADYVDLDVIGVCVIPDNFISKTGINSKARFCALAESEKQYKTAATEDTELSMFDVFGCVGESESGNWTPTNILIHNGGDAPGFIPVLTSHFDKIFENPYDPGTYWYYNDLYLFGGSEHHTASPYLYVNGEYVFNEGVYNGCVDIAVSMFSDMDGKANTTVINDDEHPAANYCATYSTNGTSAGDWYLPAIGELAFIISRFDTILNAISKVGGATPFEFETYVGYWSSTLASTTAGCGALLHVGQFGTTTKNINGYVRPFIIKD